MLRGMRPLPWRATLRAERDTSRGPRLLSVCVGGTSHRHKKPEALSCTADGLRVTTSGVGTRRCGFLCGVFHLREGVTLRGVSGTGRQERGLWDQRLLPLSTRRSFARHSPDSPSRPRASISRSTGQRPPRENPTCGHPVADLNLPHRPTPPDHPIPAPSRARLTGKPASHAAPTARRWRLGKRRGLQGARVAKKAEVERRFSKARLWAADCGLRDVANTPRGLRTPPLSPLCRLTVRDGSPPVKPPFRYGSSLLIWGAFWDFPCLGPGTAIKPSPGP